MTPELHSSLTVLEKETEIRFVGPQRALLAQFQRELHTITDQLQIPPADVTPPEKGFLAMPLTAQQEQRVASILAPVYAAEAVGIQEQLVGIPIVENGEPMINLPDRLATSGVVFSTSELPFASACGEWAGKPRVFWVRETVASNVIDAAQALKAIAVAIHLEDAFRPLGVQEGLFYRRIGMILKDHPEWVDDWDRVWSEARSKTAVNPFMAGHKSGAAVDITLRSSLTGEPLPLGNVYPEGGAKVAINYPYVTQQQWQTRMLFVQTMRGAGLMPYVHEDWHVSTGDLSAGIEQIVQEGPTTDYTAVYGPITGFDEKSGKIYPYDTADYFTPFYSKDELLRAFTKREE